MDINTVPAVVFLMVISAIWYIYLIFRNKVDPTMATWVIMLVVFWLMFHMYAQDDHKTVRGNIAMLAGFYNCFVVAIFVFISKAIKREMHLTILMPAQRNALLAAFGVWLYWLYAKEPFQCYIAVQLIAFIAYLATFARLWTAEEILEPWFFWACGFAANVLAILPSIQEMDKFGWVYLCRTIPSTGGMLFLIWRVHTGRSQKSLERKRMRERAREVYVQEEAAA